MTHLKSLGGLFFLLQDYFIQPWVQDVQNLDKVVIKHKSYTPMNPRLQPRSGWSHDHERDTHPTPTTIIPEKKTMHSNTEITALQYNKSESAIQLHVPLILCRDGSGLWKIQEHSTSKMCLDFFCFTLKNFQNMYDFFGQ
jgi:hypothetical protein